MGMTADDWTRMRADFTAVRDGNPVSIALRRGATTLAAQTVRVARSGNQARLAASAGAEQATMTVVILGDVTLDIQPGDRCGQDAGGLLRAEDAGRDAAQCTVAGPHRQCTQRAVLDRGAGGGGRDHDLFVAWAHG